MRSLLEQLGSLRESLRLSFLCLVADPSLTGYKDSRFALLFIIFGWVMWLWLGAS